jgi:hypothetical protein
MIGDFIIIFLAIASVWSAYRLFIMDTQYTTIAYATSVCLMAFVIGGIIIPNKELLNGLFSSAINGVLIDSETNKPVPNVDVVINWGYSCGEFPMHSRYSYVKSIHVRSDETGKFRAPSRYRSLAIMLFPLYNRENSNCHISIFSLDYEVINSTKSDKASTLFLKRITDYDRLTKKYEDLEWTERYGSKEGKVLASVYKAKFDQKRREYINKYGIPKTLIDRLSGR